ncbi:M55 family metallopeptidase [Glaciihabitans sp. UYNi722]|uniref:M55 family metallopeptidase n=1 Tax=Glaciihabitans sp. UYNi722 TaxID=3156344 RepID=UPI003398F6C8
MDVLISIDLEGVAGIATRQQTLPGGRDYERARVLMTAEANAAVRGAFAAGADTVLVTDSHGPADNLIAEQLDPRARLVVGDPKPLDMLQGISEKTDVVLFVGYHVGSADSFGVLAHTFSGGAFADVRLNGSSISEAKLNGLVAAEFGVPVGLVTGDEGICNVAERVFPGVVCVPVKQAVGRTAALTMHPDTARTTVEEGARRAVEAAASGSLRAALIPKTILLEAEFRPNGAAEIVSLVPGTHRIDARTVQFRAESPRQALDVIIVWSYLVGYFASR